MRRSARQHPLIMTAYEKVLTERVESGRIDEVTKGIHLGTANRLFEACVRSLTPNALLGIAAAWFRPEAYGEVIGDLGELVNERPRRPRRVRS